MILHPQINVAKLTNVFVDSVSVPNPKALIGATIRYCVLVTNAGVAAAKSVSASDNLPSTATYVAGTMLSGATCANTAITVGDDASDGGESDRVRMHIIGTTITGLAQRYRRDKATLWFLTRR